MSDEPKTVTVTNLSFSPRPTPGGRMLAYRDIAEDVPLDDELAALLDDGLLHEVPEGVNAAPAPEEPQDLAELKVAQLRDIAAEHSIDLAGATRKDDIVDTIAAAFAAADTTEGEDS